MPNFLLIAHQAQGLGWLGDTANKPINNTAKKSI
jgi:hypothetical protein